MEPERRDSLWTLYDAAGRVLGEACLGDAIRRAAASHGWPVVAERHGRLVVWWFDGAIGETVYAWRD